jgi:RND family efflux transporter MFP subunit
VSLHRALFFTALWLAAEIAHGLEITLAPAQIQSLNITLAKPQKAEAAFGNMLPAKVSVPNEQMFVVSTPQAGLVENLRVAIGDDVKRGQTVATLQSPGLLELQKDLVQTHTQWRLARSNRDRDQALFKEGVIAQRRYQESESAFQGLTAVMAQQERALHLVGMHEKSIAALKEGHLLNSLLEVVSPIDGSVIEQMAVAGQRVDAASPIYRVAGLYPLWLEIHAPIQQAMNLKRGTRVHVPAYDVSARVVAIGPDVHEADQGVLLRAEVREGANRLRPGQFVQVRIQTAMDGPTPYRLPQAALVRIAEQAGVYVRTDTGFKFQPVEVLSEQGGDVLVSGALSDEAQIAVSGVAGLKAAAGEKSSEP